MTAKTECLSRQVTIPLRRLTLQAINTWTKRFVIEPGKTNSRHQPKCSFFKKPGRPRHVVIHTGERSYKCNLCEKLFQNDKNRKVHEKTQAKEKHYKCAMCDKAFVKPNKSRNNHIRNVHGIKNNSYLKRNKNFSTLSLRKHVNNTNSGAKRRKCGLCEKYFSSNYSLERHVRIHTGEKPYKCSVCEKDFKSKTQLSVHIKSAHEKEKNHICQVCHTGFFRLKDFSAHVIVYPKKCKKCSYVSTTCNAFRKHLATHNDDRPYKCSLCDKTYKRSSHLKDHVKCVHEKVRSHTCPFCEKTFHTAKDQGEHMRTHTNERPYKCDFCQDKSSCFRYHVLRHIKSEIDIYKHTKEKAHKCSFCVKSFRDATSKKLHERRHTVEKPFTCSFCDKSFYQSTQRIYHIKKSHSNKKSDPCTT